MKLTKILIACSLLVGGITPVALAIHQKEDFKAAKADVVTKDLEDIISFSSASFSTSYIDNFFFTFSLSEQIFSNTGYFNDHITEYLDKDGQAINLAEGIVINNQTLGYWISFNPDPVGYPRNNGVVAYPLYASKTFNPVAIEAKIDALDFKVNLNYLPMDSITVTFKAGIFKGFNNNVAYELDEDLTFYSTLDPNSLSANKNKIIFVKERNEVPINPKILTHSDWGEKTNDNGGKYHRFAIYTNIPRDMEHAGDTYPANHYRNVFDNYLLNGKSLTYYNAWARGNSKDFTDLSDKTSQNPDYETEHPGGSVTISECLALYIQHPGDQPNYVALINVPNQLVTDQELGTVKFTIRQGSAWYTKDEDGNNIIGRYDVAAFNNAVIEASEELESYPDLSKYSEDQVAQINQIIDEAETNFTNAFSPVGIAHILEEAIEAIEAIKDGERARIAAVVELIDAIPAEITYTSECGEAIRKAMEAYAALIAAEIDAFPQDKLEKLYDAYAAFSALDLANYKSLSKLEIAAVANLDNYREVEKGAVQELLEEANDAIDAANSKAAVQEVVEDFYAAIALIPTDKQLTAKELSDAKDAAKAELDAIDLSKYNAEQKTQVEELINNGKVAIDQCLSVEEVELLLAKIKTVIASIKPNNGLSDSYSLSINNQTTAIISLIAVCSITLLAGMGLAIFFIRRRQLNK